ncbi:chemotaxis protein CheC [Clostridiisalibacter paucivorans]|uniref:chemotaxis protein CheC n=1 Tax=Clostridiisalibacter paucivorans TaxID=408753 RepID=UPI00047A3B41|nr:chemotaxis protein CheC [Clostridiisalibacter paucivorans]
MNIDMNNLNSTLIDVLKELGNIGSGNATTSLAKLINKKVDMEVPQVKILDFKDVSEALGNAEKTVIGIYFEMEGDIVGNIMFILDQSSARNLVDILMNREGDEKDLSDMDISALSEIGNILAASYINSLSTLTGLNIKISIPSVAIDMAGAIISVPAVQFGIMGDKVLFIETEFQEDNKQVHGDLFLIPEIESFEKILNSLGVI